MEKRTEILDEASGAFGHFPASSLLCALPGAYPARSATVPVPTPPQPATPTQSPTSPRTPGPGAPTQCASADTLSVSAASSGETTLMATPVPSSNPAVVVAFGQMWACQW